MKERIIISCNTSWGIYNFRNGLIRRLISLGYEVITTAPLDGYEKKLESLGVIHVPVQMDNKGKNPLRDYTLHKRYLQIFKDLKPDLVLNYTIKPVVYAGFAAKRLGIPYYSFITGLGTGFLRGLLLQMIVESLYRFSQSQAAAVYFLNETDANIFRTRKIVSAHRIEVLPGEGVDVSSFSPREKSNKSGEIRFLYLGRILRDKGVIEYIEAARKMKEMGSLATFSIVGDCTVKNSSAINYEELEALGMGNIFTYSPPTDDVANLIADYDCIVLPSYREGLPRTLLEASAMEKIVIATDVEGCREVVIDQKTGFLCKVKDAESLAGCMEKVFKLDSADREKMGVAGRKFVLENYSEDRVLELLLNRIESR